jgi:hypothetical protein
LRNKGEYNLKNQIDFVLPWVDGSDPDWVKEKSLYNTSINESVDACAARYRDWGILKFWFRSVEKYAPWVNKIHFITCGHLPEWLNTNYSKLHIVNHKDYIPKDALPVFSANPIENNIHLIKGLSEKFIYFNDDMFVAKPLKVTDFFRNNLPCDTAICNAESGDGISNLIMNDIKLINQLFNKYAVMKKFPYKWFNPAYGINILRNIALLPWKRFTGFHISHQPQPFLKNTFHCVWEAFNTELTATTKNRFRSCSDVNQYLFRFYHLAKGEFYPFARKDKFFECSIEHLEEIEHAFTSMKFHTLCLNDKEDMDYEEFEMTKLKLINILEKIFPNKSNFEL